MNEVPAAIASALVVRPVWRRFAPRFRELAIAFVQAGGFAAVVHSEDRVEALFMVGSDGALLPFAAWAMASIEHAEFTFHGDGSAAGLAFAFLDTDRSWTILDWCERDAVHPGPTRSMRLDCVACTACCQDADVVLDAHDLERFRSHGRGDLAEEGPVWRDAEGYLHLRFKAQRCEQLEPAGTCAIYALRPSSCRAFLPGSEPCLAAREDTLDVRDDTADANGSEDGSE